MRAHVNAKHPMAAEILSSSTESENVLECSLATSAQCSTKDNHREATADHILAGYGPDDCILAGDAEQNDVGLGDTAIEWDYQVLVLETLASVKCNLFKKNKGSGGLIRWTDCMLECMNPWELMNHVKYEHHNIHYNDAKEMFEGLWKVQAYNRGLGDEELWEVQDNWETSYDGISQCAKNAEKASQKSRATNEVIKYADTTNNVVFQNSNIPDAIRNVETAEYLRSITSDIDAIDTSEIKTADESYYHADDFETVNEQGDVGWGDDQNITVEFYDHTAISGADDFLIETVNAEQDDVSLGDDQNIPDAITGAYDDFTVNTEQDDVSLGDDQNIPITTNNVGKYPSIKWVIHRKLDTCDFGAETEDIHQKANDTEEISSQYPNAETEDVHQEANDIDYAFEGLDSGNCIEQKVSSQGSNMNSNISTEVAGSRNLNNSRSVKYAEVANNQSISTDDTKENIATPEILNLGSVPEIIWFYAIMMLLFKGNSWECETKYD